VGTTFGIDAPFTNGNEDALLFMNTLHPGGSANSQFVVIYFPAPFNSWTISSLSDIPEGREFYVFVPDPSNHTFVHRVSNPNSSLTFLNHPLLNGNPDADILFQRQFNFDNGASTTWNQNKKSLRYINDLWFLSIDNGSNFFENEDYNIVILNAFPGERCSLPKELVCGDTLEYNTEGVLNDSDESNPLDCEGFQEVGSGGQQWFSFTAEDDDYLLTLSTCESSDFVPSIAVYEGECGDFTCVDFESTPCGEGSVFSNLTFDAEQGNTYYVRVGGFGATEGEFTMQFDCQITTNVNSNIDEPQAFVVYPNPSNGNVHLNWEKKEGFGYEIQNITGKVITAGTSRTERISIDLSALASGIYLVKAFDGKEVQTQRLVISGM
ncbi:MAG: T9SS type A sorting domain-containing protein, partial [Cryomorphaceae bacterium]